MYCFILSVLSSAYFPLFNLCVILLSMSVNIIYLSAVLFLTASCQSGDRHLPPDGDRVTIAAELPHELQQ